MLDARFSHLYFCQSLNRLQRDLSAIAELLVCYSDHADVLRTYYQKVSETLDAQIVAGYMFAHGRLKRDQLDCIEFRRQIPTAAAKELLNIVISETSDVYNCFLDALNETGFQHVNQLIVTGNTTGTR